MPETTGRKIKQKLVILFLIMVVIFLALAFRLFQVQILDGDEYAAKAARQQTRDDTLQAQRGKIRDSSGLVLAQSGTSYRVLVNPQVISESERSRISIEVSDILGLDYNYVYERVSRVEKQQIVLKRQVSSEVVDQLKALQLGSGISFSTDMKRYYPMGQLFSQLVGFSGTDGEGQTGIEASYQDYLAGKNGRLVSEVDRDKNTVVNGETEYVAPTDGYNIDLTVDSVVESYLESSISTAYTANNASQVTAILMNPKNGQLLGTTTFPTFDLNAPPRSDVAALLEMSRNRCVSETYEPGSLFKLIVLAAALDSHSVTADQTFTCKGYEEYGMNKVYCKNHERHGLQTIYEALQNDCDCVFMQIAHEVGVNTLYDYIYAFGFGTETESGIPGEDTGEITHRKYIRDVELARLGCGLDLTVVPMQMIKAFSAILNGGILVKPYVVTKIYDNEGNIIKQNEPETITRVISEQTSELMRGFMVSYSESTAGSTSQINNYTSGSFSGVSNKYEEDGSASETRFITTQIQFLPANNPQLVLFLMIDEPQVPVAYGKYITQPISGSVLSSMVRYYTLLPDNGQTDRYEVPNVVNMTVSEAITALNDKHLRSVSMESEADAIVFKQLPEAGSNVPRGSRVILYTSMTTFNSEGTVTAVTVKVPNVINMRRSEALDEFEKAGLVMDFDKTNCTGYIVEQSIAADTEVAPGTSVTVTFNGYYAAAKVSTPTPMPTPEPTPTPEWTMQPNDDVATVE